MNKIIEIIAKEGLWLTQAATLEDDNNRIFVKRLAGYNVNAEDWRDATEAEKSDWEREHQPEEQLTEN